MAGPRPPTPLEPTPRAHPADPAHIRWCAGKPYPRASKRGVGRVAGPARSAVTRPRVRFEMFAEVGLSNFSTYDYGQSRLLFVMIDHLWERIYDGLVAR